MILRLKRSHVNDLRQESRRMYPVEACAMLFGYSTPEECVVEKIVVAPNELRSAERFEISPEIFVQAIFEEKKEGLDFIGLFHSHPAPAIPSNVDLKFMKMWGNIVWLIWSLTDENLAAYQMEDGELREITVNVGEKIH